jgi:predicted molibdopterin-dependent oxidoreductase YjgC
MAIETPSLPVVAGIFRAIGDWTIIEFLFRNSAAQWNYSVEAGLVSEIGSADFSMVVSDGSE